LPVHRALGSLGCIVERMFDRGNGTWLEELNPEQREAATARGAPLIVVAGAGSGKTKTLACRVAHLVGEGVPPERILLLTFSRRAARFDSCGPSSRRPAST
jgi:superfamily I DNA/RNA helicase